jgi:hypothetical protein
VTGLHSVQVTASQVLADGRVLESAKSEAVQFELAVVPSTPTSVKVGR